MSSRRTGKVNVVIPLTSIRTTVFARSPSLSIDSFNSFKHDPSLSCRFSALFLGGIILVYGYDELLLWMLFKLVALRVDSDWVPVHAGAMLWEGTYKTRLDSKLYKCILPPLCRYFRLTLYCFHFARWTTHGITNKTDDKRNPVLYFTGQIKVEKLMSRCWQVPSFLFVCCRVV